MANITFLSFLLFSMCHSIHVAVNTWINRSFFYINIINIGLDLLELFKHTAGIRFFETQCRRLYNIFPDTVYMCFVPYCESGFLCAVSGETSCSLANIMRLKSQLSDIIEPDFGLLEYLLSMKVLTRRQYDKVRTGEKAKYERNDALLDLLTTEDQCDNFLIALQQSDQQHVVNFIIQNGGQNDLT